MNRYQEIEIDGRKLLAVEVESLIRKGEDTLGVDHANLDSMDGEQLVAYLTDLRRKYQQRVESENSADAAESQEQSTEVNAAIASLKAAPVIQEVEAQEKEFDEDIDEPSEIQNIAVAPAIEDHQCAWTLACCYLWLTSKNMNERKGVMFNTPRPFQELAQKNLCHELPEEAEWTTWNRLFGDALENFLVSRESIEEYKQALKEVMCSTPHWWREKYLANSEILQEAS